MTPRFLNPDNSFDIPAIKQRAKQYARRDLRIDTGRTVRRVLREAVRDAWGDALQSYQLHTGIDCVEVSDFALASMSHDGPMPELAQSQYRPSDAVRFQQAAE